VSNGAALARVPNLRCQIANRRNRTSSCRMSVM